MKMLCNSTECVSVCACSCTRFIAFVSWFMHRKETTCTEKAVAVLVVVGGMRGGGEETSSSLQAPDGLAPEGLHPGTELPLSG